MAADFNKPVLADAYASVLQSVRDLAKDLALMLDNTGTQNIPTGAIKWNSTNARFEKYNGSAWAAMVSRMSQDVTSVMGYAPGNGSGALAVNNGTLNTNLNADQVDGYHASDMLVRGTTAAQGYSYDTYVDNAFRVLNNAGDSEGLISYDIGGSLGKLQLNFTYGGLFRFRNKTDSTSWTAWKTVYHTGNFTPNATAQNNIGAPGTYGAATFLNNVGSWAGFRFGTGVGSDNRYLMTNGGQTGEYDSGAGAWQWRWDNGTLAYGTVPWARLSGVPSFPYLPTAGGSMTGLLATKGNAAGSYLNANDSAFSVRGDSSNAAVMSFHRAGAYAINMGLDTDNVFKIGGWSAGSTKFHLNMSGQLWLENYGWLHDYFTRTVNAGYYLVGGGSGSNLTISHAPGFSGSGAPGSITISGGHITAASFNCNCNCSNG